MFLTLWPQLNMAAS